VNLLLQSCYAHPLAECTTTYEQLFYLLLLQSCYAHPLAECTTSYEQLFYLLLVSSCHALQLSPGSHSTEAAVNKQLNDKERVAAALENAALLDMVNRCLAGANAS
jgi:hypothetical protein